MSNSTNSARQRISGLLDQQSFMELGALVTARNTDFDLSQSETPSDGVITGYGLIDGNLVYVYSQDVSVMNGTVGEMHAKKIAGLYDLAMKTGSPVIGLIDSAGLRLQEATDALNAFGTIYRKQTLASGVIPQITAILGSCGGGLALFPTLTDFTFMEEKNAKLFVNAPNALDGNVITKCDSSSAAFQAGESGIVDVVGDEASVLTKIRELIGFLPSNNSEGSDIVECADDLNRVNAELAGCVGDTSIALSILADNSDFFELKAGYAKDMVVGFLKLDGVTVGAVANRSEICDEEGKVAEKLDAVLSPEGCEKAAEFVNFCDAFDIPLLTLTNVKGYQATVSSEKEIARAAARLTYAFANATVPRVNVVIGGEKLSGTVGNVTPSVNNGVIKFVVFLDDQGNTRLRSGLKVDVHVTHAMKDETLRLPTGAYYMGRGDYDLWVVNGGRVEKRKVMLGESGFEYVEVLQGLTGGEKVIISDMGRYRDKEVLYVR